MSFLTGKFKKNSQSNPKDIERSASSGPEPIEATIEQEVAVRLEARAVEIEARIQADAEQRIQGEVARIQAEADRRVATEVAQKVQVLLEQAQLNRQRLFGRSSEAHPGQGALFNEAEQAAELEPAEADAPPTTPDHPPASAKPRKARGKRKSLPPDLPRVDFVVDVADNERPCDCGTPLIQIGEDVSEQLDIMPMKVQVIRTIRPRYACPRGEAAPTSPRSRPRRCPAARSRPAFWRRC